MCRRCRSHYQAKSRGSSSSNPRAASKPPQNLHRPVPLPYPSLPLSRTPPRLYPTKWQKNTAYVMQGIFASCPIRLAGLTRPPAHAPLPLPVFTQPAALTLRRLLPKLMKYIYSHIWLPSKHTHIFLAAFTHRHAATPPPATHTFAYVMCVCVWLIMRQCVCVCESIKNEGVLRGVCLMH